MKEDYIHLWKADSQALENNIEYFSKLLNTEETQRADRYKKELFRRRFTVFRGVLRILLSKYLSCTPEAVVFSYSDSGKPYLKDSNINFNLSHTADKGVFAFRKSVPVGIDIERINHNKECLKLAKRFFSDREYRELKELDEDKIDLSFAKCWVRKEAFVKAMGKGLSYGLEYFSVSIYDENENILSDNSDMSSDIAKWKLPIFYPFDNTVCAAAVYSRVVIDCFDFNNPDF